VQLGYAESDDSGSRHSRVISPVKVGRMYWAGVIGRERARRICRSGGSLSLAWRSRTKGDELRGGKGGRVSSNRGCVGE
jgi:hypothetical protein